MVDACIIDRPTGQATDPTTGAVVTTYSAPIYTGRCEVQQVGTMAAKPVAGESQWTILGHVVKVPVDAVVYRVGDRVRMTAAILDPTLVGRTFLVTSMLHKTHATSRRLVCDEEVA
jgi:hypothetical protein